MAKPRSSRWDILKSAAALPFVYAAPLRAERRQLTWYTSADLQLAEKAGKIFEQKFFGIRASNVRAESKSFPGSHRNIPRGLHVADAVSTGDAAQFLAWKRQGMLAP